MRERRYLERLDISRYNGDQIGGMDFVTLYGKVNERIRRSSDVNSNLNFVNILTVQFLKTVYGYNPKLGDYVYYYADVFPEDRQGFGVRAIKYLPRTRYYEIEIIAADIIQDEVVKANFLQNIQRKTISVVDLMNGDYIYHNTINPPPGDFGQRLFARAFLPNGTETDAIQFEQNGNNAVRTISSGVPFTGTVTLEKR